MDDTQDPAAPTTPAGRETCIDCGHPWSWHGPHGVSAGCYEKRCDCTEPRRARSTPAEPLDVERLRPMLIHAVDLAIVNTLIEYARLSRNEEADR